MIFTRLLRWWLRRGQAKRLPTDMEQARQLIAAVDSGGVPLNPAKINAIARALGLEVKREAPVPETIERIRACVKRSST